MLINWKIIIELLIWSFEVLFSPKNDTSIKSMQAANGVIVTAAMAKKLFIVPTGKMTSSFSPWNIIVTSPFIKKCAAIILINSDRYITEIIPQISPRLTASVLFFK